MVNILHSVKEALKEIDTLYFLVRKAKFTRAKARALLLGDKHIIEHLYLQRFGRKPDLAHPKTFTEKIQWLKLYDRRTIHTTLADKYAVREWLAKHFGEEYLIPLLFTTTDYREIKPENIPDVPCIIKSNHASGTWYICRDKKLVDWTALRRMCINWLSMNYYYISQEWQYKNIPPRIIVEKLLLTREGTIPNDYKLHFFNGRLGFVYCSLDREGGNYRNMYSPDWEPMYFTQGKHTDRGPEVEPPASFGKMLDIGSQIARLFRYVRVDFYDVDGKLYYGEITLHHGSGFDKFSPESYDYYFGDMIDLNAPVLEDLP